MGKNNKDAAATPSRLAVIGIPKDRSVLTQLGIQEMRTTQRMPVSHLR